MQLWLSFYFLQTGLDLVVRRPKYKLFKRSAFIFNLTDPVTLAWLGFDITVPVTYRYGTDYSTVLLPSSEKNPMKNRINNVGEKYYNCMAICNKISYLYCIAICNKKCSLHIVTHVRCFYRTLSFLLFRKVWNVSYRIVLVRYDILTSTLITILVFTGMVMGDGTDLKILLSQRVSSLLTILWLTTCFGVWFVQFYMEYLCWRSQTFLTTSSWDGGCGLMTSDDKGEENYASNRTRDVISSFCA